ncbi:MAG: autotransporter-associated beta strand repeat-containing protein [Caulobacter sp.]
MTSLDALHLKLTGATSGSFYLDDTELTAGQSGYLGLSGVIAGSGGVTVNALMASVTLSGQNTYTGETKVLLGTLNLTGGDAIANGNHVHLNPGGRLVVEDVETIGYITGGDQSSIELRDDLILSGQTGSEYRGSIFGFGALKVVDGHWATLGSLNISTGGVQVHGARIWVENGSLGTGVLTLNDGEVEAVSSMTVSNAVELQAGGGQFAARAGQTLTLNGSITGAGRLTKTQTGTLVVNDATGLTGDIQIEAGLLEVGTNDLNDDAAVTVASGASFKTGADIIGSLNGAGSIEFAGRLQVVGGETDAISGVISGSGVLSKNQGHLTLSAANTFSGGMEVMNRATLIVETDEAAGSGTIGIVRSELGTTSGSVTLSNAILVVNDVTFNTAGTSQLTLTGAISGTSPVIKGGSGTLFLNGANTFDGLLFIREGVLVARHDNALGTDLTRVLGRLELEDDITVANNIELSGGANGGVLRNASGSNTVSGDIGGSGSIVQASSGQLNLTGNNTNTGQTTIEHGVLVVRSGNAIGDSSAVTVQTGGQLHLHDNETIGSLSGDGTVQFVAAADLTVGNSNTSTVFSGRLLEGVGRLIKVGAATLTLTGNNADSSSYGAGSIGTVVQDGELQIGAGGTSGMIRGNVVTNADLIFNRSDDIQFGTLGDTANGVISGSGHLIKAGSGSLRLEGANTFTGVTNVEAGTLSIGGKHLSDITVRSGAKLKGDGEISASVTVMSGGSLVADYGLGSLKTGSLTLASGAAFEVDFGGSGPSAVKTVEVTGSISLNGATLRHTAQSSFAVNGGENIVLISNDGTEAVSGTFDGLAEGAAVVIGGTDFTVSYRGGDGNDVTLYAAATPPTPQPGPAPQPTAEFSAPQIRVIFAAAAGFALNSAKALASNITLPDGTVVANPAFETAVKLAALIARFEAGLISRDGLIDGVVDLAAPTSGVALSAYQFFTGSTPSAAGMAWLIDSPDNANDLTDAYYARFNEVNRFINFAVSLGTQGDGAQAFEAKFGALDFQASVRTAYDMIIGLDAARAAGVDVDAALAWIVNQEGYFDAFAGSDLGGKAAMIGYLMQAGFEAKVGRYYEAAHGFIEDNFEGQTAYQVDLVGGQHLG